MLEKTVLDSGLVVLTEYISFFPSFALSYTLRGGSRNETRQNCGIHHLIEHMLFKGNTKYDLKQIADISDRMGGKLNALTGKEITQFYIKAVDEHLEGAFDLLTRMVRNSTFPAEEFLKEKNVAIQEIHEADDNPDTNAFETFYQKIFGDNGLAFSVGGMVESVSAFERDSVYDFYKSNYTPDNLVLAAVGKVRHQELVDLAAEAFKDFPAQKPRNISFQTPSFSHHVFSKKNASLKQAYVIIGFDGIPIVSPYKNQFMILNDILGAGMSSRLFQSIREEKGLAYTVSSFSDAYLDCGTHLTYSIVEPGKIDEYLEAVKEEISLLKTQGISKDELERARDSIKSSVILGLESRVSKMRFNVNNELFLAREVTPEEIITDINNTTIEDINQLFKDYFNLDRMAVFFYGDVPG
jgi:predicted Zn-dependent peptidase